MICYRWNVRNGGGDGKVNVYIPDKKGRILVPEKFMSDIKFKD